MSVQYKQEDISCLCAAGKCPHPAHTDSRECDEEVSRLGIIKSQNTMVCSFDDRWVETMLHFVATSPNADFHLSLEAGEALCKLSFVMDRFTYK